MQMSVLQPGEGDGCCWGVAGSVSVPKPLLLLKRIGDAHPTPEYQHVFRDGWIVHELIEYVDVVRALSDGTFTITAEEIPNA